MTNWQWACVSMLVCGLSWASGGAALYGQDQPDQKLPPAGTVELLWPAGAPGAVGQEAADQPSLTHFPAPADRANGAAVLIFPGGGYGHLAIGHEGTEIAEWLNSQGISAYMVKYRLAPRYRHPAPLQDAQRALRIVRSHAAAWGIDPQRIGAIGFSAGGHLVSTLGTHFDAGRSDAEDTIERASCRPDFLILCYPVISLNSPFTHIGSRNNLLGNDSTPEQHQALSNERNVTGDTPPTFLFHTSADTAVPPQNSMVFYNALHAAGVPAEMHIYETGRHGVGLAAKDPVLSSWPQRCADWLKARGYVTHPAK